MFGIARFLDIFRLAVSPFELQMIPPLPDKDQQGNLVSRAVKEDHAKRVENVAVARSVRAELHSMCTSPEYSNRRGIAQWMLQRTLRRINWYITNKYSWTTESRALCPEITHMCSSVQASGVSAAIQAAKTIQAIAASAAIDSEIKSNLTGKRFDFQFLLSIFELSDKQFEERATNWIKNALNVATQGGRMATFVPQVARERKLEKFWGSPMWVIRDANVAALNEAQGVGSTRERSPRNGRRGLKGNGGKGKDPWSPGGKDGGKAAGKGGKGKSFEPAVRAALFSERKALPKYSGPEIPEDDTSFPEAIDVGQAKGIVKSRASLAQGVPVVASSAAPWLVARPGARDGLTRSVCAA